MKKKQPHVMVPFSTRKLRRDLIDELRLYRIRTRRTMASALNEALELGVNALLRREAHASE